MWRCSIFGQGSGLLLPAVGIITGFMVPFCGRILEAKDDLG